MYCDHETQNDRLQYLGRSSLSLLCLPIKAEELIWGLAASDLKRSRCTSSPEETTRSVTGYINIGWDDEIYSENDAAAPVVCIHHILSALLSLFVQSLWVGIRSSNYPDPTPNSGIKSRLVFRSMIPKLSYPWFFNIIKSNYPIFKQYV